MIEAGGGGVPNFMTKFRKKAHELKEVEKKKVKFQISVVLFGMSRSFTLCPLEKYTSWSP